MNNKYYNHQGDGEAVPFYVKQKPELLAPAGDLSVAKTVIRAGADAVYFGGAQFGARAYAENFSYEDVDELVRFAHVRDARAYLAFNTVIKNPEMERSVYDALRHYYELGVDAFIIQDFGLIPLIRDCFPDVSIHASTQMNIHSVYGARFLKNKGVKRVITARELSVSEIQSIHNGCDIDLEVFIHGALCVCYSGQCLMSSMIGGRSGNRGRCAQPCRQPYALFDGKKKIDTPGDYIISPKDLCGINHISDLAAAGVTSFKIEGRMKSKDYASAVVSVYRKYIDRLMEGEVSSVSDSDYRTLVDAGSRSGFTDLYFSDRNGSGLIGARSPKHKINHQSTSSFKDNPRPIQGEFRAYAGQPLTFKVYFRNEVIEISDGICERAARRATTACEIASKLAKTGDFAFSFKDISIQTDDSVFVPMKSVNALKREMMGRIEEILLKKSTLRPAKPMVTLNSTSRLHSHNFRNKPLIYARVRTKCQLNACLKSDSVDFIIIPAQIAGNVELLRKNTIISIPTVVRKRELPKLSALVQANSELFFEADSYDALAFLLDSGISPERIFGGIRMYALSDRTRQAFGRLGIKGLVVPVELSKNELRHRDNSKDRLVVYGRLPVMITANCVRKNSLGCKNSSDTADNGLMYIKDRRGMEFPVDCDCFCCANIIYNSRPIWLYDKISEISTLDTAGIEYDFVDEDYETVLAVLAGDYVPKEYTRGHFSRGVE